MLVQQLDTLACRTASMLTLTVVGQGLCFCQRVEEDDIYKSQMGRVII